MIIVKLMGGLGNQMFQYALGRRLSLLHNTILKVDTSFLNDKSHNHTLRKYELDVFSMSVSIATKTDLNKFSVASNGRLRRLLPFLAAYRIINEPCFEFNEDILKSPKHSLLIGYWQTEKYFLPIQDTIREDFKFRKPLEGKNADIASGIIKQNAVSMHIRRGDYVHHEETSKVHGACPTEYYTAALRYIQGKVKDVHLYIFSDDMAWVKDNMFFDAPATYVEHNSGKISYADMQLMSLCRHNIIANSSFSWWGAWLNPNPGKLVVAPAKWFNDGSANTKDLIPEGWQKI